MAVEGYDKIVYVFQGGGALGSYQVGVYEGLSQQGLLPDWIIGTSIGAINGAILAGNKPEHRLKKLNQFWQTITSPLSNFLVPTQNNYLRKLQNFWVAQHAILFGIPGFFKPKIISPWLVAHDTPSHLGLYDTDALRSNLLACIDFDLINAKKVRLTLGALQLESGEMNYFDSKHQVLGVEHVMASAALPPAFPAIEINGKHYWDGGVSSNTPLTVVIENRIPEKLLCFVVNLFTQEESLPTSMMSVMKRKKDIEFAGRYRKIMDYFYMFHRLQHKLHVAREKHKDEPHQTDIEHQPMLNISRFHYHDQPCDLWCKDFEFSKQSLREHYEAGLNDVMNAVEKPTWLAPIEKSEYIVMHNY